MTAIARKLRPGRFLSFIVTAWGLVMVGHGLVHAWRPMLALRILLGILEAGFFSSCAYLLSTWYTRAEVAKRNAAFYLLGSLIAGFGGILAYGVSEPKGDGTKAVVDNTNLLGVVTAFQDEWCRRLCRMEMDLHHGRHHYCVLWPAGIFPDR